MQPDKANEPEKANQRKEANQLIASIPSLLAMLFFFVMFCSTMIKTSFGPSYLRPTPVPGSSLGLGRQGLLALRHTTGEPYEGLWIDTDGVAYRSLYPIASREPQSATTTVTPEEMVEIETLRRTWCNAIPPSVPLTHTMIFMILPSNAGFGWCKYVSLPRSYLRL